MICRIADAALLRARMAPLSASRDDGWTGFTLDPPSWPHARLGDVALLGLGDTKAKRSDSDWLNELENADD
jgi:hypothetical protein